MQASTNRAIDGIHKIAHASHFSCFLMFLVHSIRHMNSYMRFMAIAAGIPWNDMARQWMPFQTTNTPSDATKLLHTKSFANIQPIKPTQSSISSRHKGQSTMIHRSITDPYKDQKPATGQARFYHSYTWQERRSGTTTFCLVSDYFQFRKSFLCGSREIFDIDVQLQQPRFNPPYEQI